MNRKASRFLAYPYMIWMAGFTVIPLLMVFYYGLTDRSGAFTLANILAIGSSEHLKALWLSLALAGVSTVICLLLAYPLALILRKRHIGKGSFVVFIFILPKTDSLTILSRTVGYYTLFSKRLQPIIRYYSVCICCSSVAHHIILLHLIESNPQGLFPRIRLNYVIIFLLLLFFSYR